MGWEELKFQSEEVGSRKESIKKYLSPTVVDRQRERRKHGLWALAHRSKASWHLYFLSVLNSFVHMILRMLREEIRIIAGLHKR